jgi:hypothetical protein
MRKIRINFLFNIFIIILIVNCIFLLLIHKFIDFKWINNEESHKLFNSYFEIIQRPKYEINCNSLIEMDAHEMNKTISILGILKYPDKEKIELISDLNFIFNSSMCNSYKTFRGFDNLAKISEQFELDFPLAYSISIYKNTEQFERLLRLIWRPQNHYCLHIDSKAKKSFRASIQSISNCFDNVFISKSSQDIIWGGFSILKAQLNCMQELFERDKKWRYLINMAGDEFPLKTNYELVKILKMYNGSNEVQIINKRYLNYRFEYIYGIKLEGLYKNVRPTMLKKSPPPHNYSIMKGYTYAILSREFSSYILTNEKVRDLIEWSKDMINPDEM